MKHFKRVRKTWNEFVWRGVYAGRTMEVTRCTWRQAWAQANDAFVMYRPHVHDINPRALADKRIAIWGTAKK